MSIPFIGLVLIGIGVVIACFFRKIPIGFAVITLTMGIWLATSGQTFAQHGAFSGLLGLFSGFGLARLGVPRSTEKER